MGLMLRRVTGPAEAAPECYDVDVDVPVQPRDERIGGQLDAVNRDREFHTVRSPATCLAVAEQPTRTCSRYALLRSSDPHRLQPDC